LTAISDKSDVHKEGVRGKLPPAHFRANHNESFRMLLCGDVLVPIDEDRTYTPRRLKDYKELWMFNG
jgi:hypothetical protein